MKRNYKFLILCISVILLSILVYSLSSYHFVFSSPSDDGQTTFCQDSDGTLDLISQSKTQGFVLFLYKTCDWSSVSTSTFNPNACLFTLTYNDYCLDSKAVREKTCSNNAVLTREVLCTNGCADGRCK